MAEVAEGTHPVVAAGPGGGSSREPTGQEEKARESRAGALLCRSHFQPLCWWVPTCCEEPNAVLGCGAAIWASAFSAA